MHISTLIAQTVETYLENCLAGELESYGLENYEIKIGRLQADPERPAINLMVHVGEPRSDKWFDEASGARYIRHNNALAGYDHGEVMAIGEVGGGRTWLRRFTVEGSVFFTRTREDRDTANELANTVRGLIENYLSPEIVTGLTDDWGEEAWRLLLSRSKAQERGGPRAHIWDFWVYFSVETIRSH
jgi:hypothetical protein